jgi:hypothetical protein
VAGMGPPPKPAGTRARRNGGTQGMTTLDAASREGKEPPAWPLMPDLVMARAAATAAQRVERLRGQLNATTDRRKVGRLERALDEALGEQMTAETTIEQQREQELALWAELWVSPQAAEWEKLAWTRDVAQYVRHKIQGEAGDLEQAKEARQWSDRLGLNPQAMQRLRWETARTKEAEQRGAKRGERSAPAPASGGAQPGTPTDPRRGLHSVS